MDVELMRRLDRVPGDAACSVLATAHRLRKPFTTPRPVRKIAVMKFFGMGSVIVASRGRGIAVAEPATELAWRVEEWHRRDRSALALEASATRAIACSIGQRVA